MKKITGILFPFLFAGAIFAASPYAVWDGKTIPPLQGRVNDFAEVLSADEESQLAAISEQIEQATTCQVVVVTINSLGGDTIENYGLTVGRGWGIGYSDKNNGILIIASMDDRRMRIEVGYGLEGTLTDIWCGRVIDYVMKPAFRKGDYFAGFKGALELIQSELTDSETPEEFRSAMRSEEEDNSPQAQGLKVAGAILLIVGVLSVFVLNIFTKKQKREKVGCFYALIGGILMFAGICMFELYAIMRDVTRLFTILIISIAVSSFINSIFYPNRGRRGGGRYYGGFGGSGFHSGGFGGGGGSFGGGGASGGW